MEILQVDETQGNLELDPHIHSTLTFIKNVKVFQHWKAYIVFLITDVEQDII